MPRDGRLPVIEFRRIVGSDTRDLFESGIDVLVTADASVIDYAGNLSGFEGVPLAWDVTYALLATTRVQALRRREDVGAIGSAALDELARDAVTGDARGHRTPGWWSDLGDCPAPSDLLAGLPPVPRGAYGSSDRRLVAYASGERTARDH